ncbi:hypothetical protein ES703_109028 [subsurface metagenome]
MKNIMRRLRFDQKKTLDDLWLLTRIRPSRLSLFEREYLDPNKEDMKKIARALRTSIKKVFPIS